MVLVRSAPLSRLAKVHPNPARILGIAGAIALNTAMFMLLLMPMQAPMPVLSLDRIPITWVMPETKKDPPPLPPVPIKPDKPRTDASTPTVSPPIPAPTVVDPVIDPMGTIPIEPIVQGPVIAPTTEPALPPGPLTGAQLGLDVAPAPVYPREELRAGITGLVMLEVLVDVDGRPLQVTVHASSGNRELDATARKQVLKRWRFHPAMRDGIAVQASGLVAVEFKLDQ